jgi:hypothetical protein
MFNRQNHDAVLRQSEQNGGSCLIGWYYSEYPDMKYFSSYATYRAETVSPARKNK